MIPPARGAPPSSARLVAGLAAAALALALGVLAAWPIYRTAWLWLAAAVALVLGGGIAWARGRWRIPFPVLAAIVLASFALTVVPVAVPQSLTSGPLRGLLDGLASAALGWKQLLTLSLPVGTYRTVLVPAYIVLLLSALLVVGVAQHPGRRSALAAIPMLAPVAFGTVFGASEVSATWRLGPLSIAAPREIGLWLTAAALAAVWVAWISGAGRRAALRLGRAAGDRGGGAARALAGAGILAVALAAGFAAAPVLGSDARAVPRDRVVPEIVVRERPSPLAAYRNSKRDDAIDRVMFTVTGDRGLPQRLRLAVLDSYDGSDFHVSRAEAGRFTRFPSGEPLSAPSSVTVEVGEGYADIWAPTAILGSPPSFSGPRAEELSDGFYVNRETGGAIAVPRGDRPPGLAAGDGYTADMETAPPGGELGGPGSEAPLVDLEAAPELAAWIERQGVGTDAEGLAELIERLRARGYLSHSMSNGDGERAWIDRLGERYGTRFEPSPGGHSLARIEDLFAQLNAQQSAAGDRPGEAMLVAGVGDDEQFAAAAALLARALGYEARVVLGVRLGGDGVPGVPACTGACTGENLAAWIEVRGDRGEWVSLDVTPQLENRPQRLEEGEQLPEFPTTPEERDVREVDPPRGLGEPGESDGGNSDGQAASWLWPVLRAAGLSLSAALLLLVPLLFLPCAKRLRRRRRRADPVPELRALGAWEEMLDRARDAGVRIPAGATRSEAAAALATAPAAWAAARVDRAVFSPDAIGDEEAARLWRAADDDRAERAARMSRLARLRAEYSLRSYGIAPRSGGIGQGRRRPAPPESEAQ
ncbi:transglutaminase domain-containing protein [Leucobacter sp. wl10]|uniref:transglutaminase domain-containing protein n=1 Tax=Leucobacter sp. wl10 TaxID=2304677 RepID=UPI000E5AB2BA|nr:transglutaminase domain-containing protein [Leucobacter sp. wl10]RGE23224.1 hypothetical protein D1J51_03030 [Leucobacter sp. wl10]